MIEPDPKLKPTQCELTLNASQESDFRALSRCMSFGQSTFALRKVVCDQDEMKDLILGKLTADKIAYLAVTLPAAFYDPVETVRSTVAQGDNRCIIIFGYSEKLESASPDNPGEYLGILNRSRERWKDAFPNQTIIFWLSDKAAQVFTQGAPDIQAWCGSEFDFNS